MPEVKTALEGELYVLAGTINWSAGSRVGTRVGFCEGASYSWNRNATGIWDRGTFSHWKSGRGNGELTIPVAYVDNQDVITALESGTVAGSSHPLIQAEIRCLGSAQGNLEHCIQFSDLHLKGYERNEDGEDGKTTFSMSFDMMKEPVRATATRIN